MTAYHVYMTDAIKAIGNLDGIRYYELIDKTPPDTRTASEVIDYVKESIAGVV